MTTSSSANASLSFGSSKVGMLLLALTIHCGTVLAAEPGKVFNVQPASVASSQVKFDYDLVYIRVLRGTDGKEVRWAEFGHPTNMEIGSDLMLLHADGSEELLVSGKDGSCMDPYVDFDGETVLFTKFVDEKQRGADIHKIHVPTRKITKLRGSRPINLTSASVRGPCRSRSQVRLQGYFCFLRAATIPASSS